VVIIQQFGWTTETKPLSGLESMGDWKVSETANWLLINELEVLC
jgi:hypothetical protein